MAISYITASTGATDAGGAFTITGAAPSAAGNIIILQIVQDGTTDGAVTFTSATNIENLAGTDNTWTAIGEYSVGGSDEARQYLWIGRSLSTTAPTFTGGNSTSEDVFARMYEFSGVSKGGTLALVIENGTAGGVASAAATSNSVADVGVTTLGLGRLALNFIATNDDPQATELTAMTGETGGDWTYPVAAYGDSAGTDGTIALVTAVMASAGTINGGTDAITSCPWGVVGFALIPEFSPTVTLGTNVVDAATITDTTPAFQFTGTDANASEVEYEVQVDTVNTFNGQSAPYDPDGVWTDDAQAFDGSTSTYAQTTTQNGSTSQYYIKGEGTNAPTSGDSITQVRARMFSYELNEAQEARAYYYTDGLVEELGFTNDTGGTDWSAYTTLAVPTGGWNWEKVSHLEVKGYLYSSTYIVRFYRFEVEVTHDSGVDTYYFDNSDTAIPLIDTLSSTDDDANWSGTGSPNPFPSGNEITYTIPAGSALPAGDTYYWRVRATDPGGSNTWGAWSSPTRSFTISAGAATNVVQMIISNA